MKKIFTCLFFTLLISGAVYAQHIEGVAGFVKGGYMHAPASGKTFNQIAPTGIAGFTSNYFVFGAEAYYRKYKNIYTAEGTMGVQKQHTYNNANAEPFCGAAHVKWGKIIAENEYSWLYPSLGAGAAILQLTTYEKWAGRIDNNKEKTLLSPSLDAAVNADFLLSKANWREGYFIGWMLGIRAGYRAAVSSSKWKEENTIKPYYMPKYANKAFYVTITIGGGSFDKR